MRLKWDSENNVLTVPKVHGVDYQVEGTSLEPGDYTLDQTTTVTAVPKDGVKFKEGAETEWTFEVTPPRPVVDEQQL